MYLSLKTQNKLLDLSILILLSMYNEKRIAFSRIEIKTNFIIFFLQTKTFSEYIVTSTSLHLSNWLSST